MAGRREIAVGRQFLFLQGPHGPFFRELARALRKEGAGVLKAGVNRADDREWGDIGPYRGFTDAPEAWRDWIEGLIVERGVTDIVLYGDTRAYHAAAIDCARALGLKTHVFEEGYLRPFWVTYERGGSNGHSRLMQIPVEAMRDAAIVEDYEPEAAPPHWGAAWRHALHGFRYHSDILFRNRAYPHFTPHRPTDAWQELGFYLKRLLLLPLLIPERRWRERAVLRSGRAYHLVLLQLAVDASMRSHSHFPSMAAFIDACLEAFAEGAPAEDQLVFKAHPFEDGRDRLEAYVRRKAATVGLRGRVVFLHGGKLGALLDRSRSAVTVNSTAGQQALWRGLPLSAQGAAVYDKPEFIAEDRDLAAFFKAPKAPDAKAYRIYRQFLLMSSQIRGGYYSRAGRRSAIAQITPKMLDSLDPYERAMQIGRDAVASAKVFPRIVAGE